MNILDRIQLLNIIPSEWSFEDLIIFEDITKKVNFSQKEITDYGIKTLENWNLRWDKDKDKKLDFTEAEKNLIKGILKKKSEEKKLSRSYLSLYKTFVA